MSPKTLYEKVWEQHVVKQYDDGSSLLYIDRHLVQEVSSPQSFAGLIAEGRPLRRPDAHVAVADHAVPTKFRHLAQPEGLASRQVSRLEQNCERFGINYIPMRDDRHGIVHVIGPELGFTLPGITLVCGDSHTSTHGAFGAIAFGIGASECECVLATQTLRQRAQKTMRVTLDGVLPEGVAVKDIILALIARIGTDGGVDPPSCRVMPPLARTRWHAWYIALICGAGSSWVTSSETTISKLPSSKSRWAASCWL